MSVESILATLSPKLRGKLGTADELTTPEVAEFPVLGLNRALGGGLRYGRQHLVYGNKSAGKSSLLMELIANEQCKGKTAAWVDVEQTYDPDWAGRLGVDNSKLIVSNARSINEMVDVGVELMHAKADILVVDSISTLLPAIYFEKDSDNLKEIVDTGQIGAEAKDMARAVKMLNYANNQGHETLLVLVSQTRNSIGQMYASIQPTGGKAVQFYSSTIIQLFSSESENQAIKGKIHVGDKILEEKVGRKVRWDLKFSKTSPAFQSGDYDFYFRGDTVGVDPVADIVDTAIGLGIIKQGRSWYTVEGEQIQGRRDLLDAVRNSPELQAKLAGKISEV